MSMAGIQGGTRWKPIAMWGFKGLLAVVFLAAGGAKLYGVPMLVEQFDHIGLGQWFRYFTGLLEITGGLGLLIPSLSGIAATLLGCVMVGATATHLFIIGGSPIPAIVLLVLCAVIAVLDRAQVAAAAIFLKPAG
jgi:putative oxidoreductase